MAESKPTDLFLQHMKNSMESAMKKNPLHHAVLKGNRDTVIALVESGDDINAVDAFLGYSALHYADSCNDPEMAKCLVGLGAEMGIKDKMGMDAFFSAAIGGRIEMLKCLANLGANVNTNDGNVTSMHRAAHSNMKDVVRCLAELGADVNVKEIRGFGHSPLRYTVGKGDLFDMVRLLIELGADPNQVDNIGVTAVGAAASEGNWKMVECLADLGADINFKNRAGMTPLAFAVNRGFPDAVKMLIDNGAELNRTDLFLSLPLRAISNHDETTLELLLDGGLNPNIEMAMTYRGLSPLYFAATLGNNSAVSLLINAGANIHFHNDTGMTPLHGACIYGQIDTARLLLLAGANISEVDKRDRKPLDCLPFKDIVSYALERKWEDGIIEKEVDMNVHPDVQCPQLESLHTLPGIGNCLAIPGLLARRVFADIKGVIEKLPHQQGSVFSDVKIQQVGSSAEETRTGLPNEMDFAFPKDLGLTNKAVHEVGYGYALFTLPDDAAKAYMCVKGSKSFHDVFGDLFNNFNEMSEGSKVTFMEGTREVVKDEDRKACTPMMLCWSDGHEQVAVSVDAVPCIHINDWPATGVRRTWLMDYDTLKERGYNLIPKTPNQKSEIARGYSLQELEEVWRISFSHLETEHMYKVPQKIKAVYVTAKCIRNPDVCHILIGDKGGRLKTVESYLVSYLLKMTFFQRVGEWLDADLPLGQMVCQLFEDIELGLTRNHIPLFFMPDINVLDGLKLDVNKCAAVAKIMSKFVRALYIRDNTPIDDDQEDLLMTVYKRVPTSFNVYDVSGVEVRSGDQRSRVLKMERPGLVSKGESMVDVLANMMGLLQQVNDPEISITEVTQLIEKSALEVKKIEELVKDNANDTNVND